VPEAADSAAFCLCKASIDYREALYYIWLQICKCCAAKKKIEY
jgi:hypothetical protein